MVVMVVPSERRVDACSNLSVHSKSFRLKVGTI